jgi:hypothetical protein
MSAHVQSLESIGTVNESSSSVPASNLTHLASGEESFQRKDVEVTLEFLTALAQRYPLPPKLGSKAYTFLRFEFFTLYRRLFTFIFVVNIAVFVGLLATNPHGQLLALDRVLDAAAANLAVSVLMRNSHVINAFFRISERVPTSHPLWFRRVVSRVFHHGGIHSGCAVSGTVWAILFFALVAQAHATNSPPQIRDHPEIIIITTVVIVSLLTILIFAHPELRNRYHNTFENVHRYVGWLIVGLLWAFIIVFANALRGSTSLGEKLVQSPSLWFLIIITLCIIYPWLYLRKVPVRSEYLSEHAVRLHFNHLQITHCVGIGITDNPLKEWHAFVTFPDRFPYCYSDSSLATSMTASDPSTVTPEKTPGFSVVVSNAGDWTSRIIQQQPTHIWTRGIPTMGFCRITKLFSSVVLVATGSGIGPALSLIVGKPVKCRILWSTRDPDDVYGQGIKGHVLDADPNAVIVNTTKIRRPDLVGLGYALYKESGAEAVFTISNRKLTYRMMTELESRGVPSYGPIFDS